jgi:pyruvate ferredoxin oxidoreductase beta subunit
MVAHNLPYVATVNPSYPFDLVRKIEKAMAVDGPSYIHAYAACPTGWRMRPELAVQIGRLAVETGVFPLYEVENGRYRITVETPEFKPLRDYLKPQGRFRHLTPDLVEEVEARLHAEYRQLEAKVRMTGEEEA